MTRSGGNVGTIYDARKALRRPGLELYKTNHLRRTSVVWRSPAPYVSANDWCSEELQRCITVVPERSIRH
jgi:hypothetical protein